MLLPIFQLLEYKASDALFVLRGQRPQSGEYVIIAIDDATDSALDTRWPYPRQYHARLLNNLFELGAKQVIMDVAFTEQSNPDSDKLLADTAFYHQNTIFAGKYMPQTRIGEPARVQAPIKAIRDKALSWGIVNVSPDQDNLVRSYTLFEMHDGEPQYSLGIAALANSRIYQPDWAQHIRLREKLLNVADRGIPIQHKNRSLINFYGPEGSFEYISYASVLDDSTMNMPGYYGVELNEFYDLKEQGILAGKTALVGASIAELHDNYPTPMGAAWMPGVEIHANFLEMVHNEDYLSTVNYWYYLLIEFVLIFAFYLIFNKLKPRNAALVLLVIFAAQYYAAWWLFNHKSLMIPIVQSALAYFCVYVISFVKHYMVSLKEKKFIRNAFQQYMAPELVNELLRQPGKLSYGGNYQELSVLFSDIRGFTTYAEKYSPQETVNILREYLTAMVEVIIQHNGIVDKFVGDEIMALYGVPLPSESHALDACKTALTMRESLNALQEKWLAEGRESFEIGIGINSGGAIVGNLGSEQIFDYTAIGDTINLGARLESINKDYQTNKHIIISEYSYRLVKEQVEVRYLDEVKVKGKQIAVKIYELIRLK